MEGAYVGAFFAWPKAQAGQGTCLMCLRQQCSTRGAGVWWGLSCTRLPTCCMGHVELGYMTKSVAVAAGTTHAPLSL